MTDEDEQDENDDSGVGEVIGGLILVLLILVGGYYGLSFLGPDEVKLGENPSFISQVFSDRWMLGMARLIVIFAGVYVVYSVVVHMNNGRPLNAAGPVKVEPAEKAAELGDALSGEARELRQDLAASQADVESLIKIAETLEAENEQLRASIDVLQRGLHDDDA